MPIDKLAGLGVGGDLDMARACFDLGDYDETIRIAREALPFARDAGEKFRALHLIACSEGCRGDLKPSLKTLELVGEFLDLLPAQSKAKFYGQRAYAHS